MYYIFQFPLATHNTVSCVYLEKFPGYERADFFSAVSMGSLPLLNFIQPKNDTGVLLDFVPSTPSCMLISERFKASLLTAGVNNTEYYPAQVTKEATGEVYNGYYAMNILERIACVDRQQSIVISMPGVPEKIFKFEKMHLDYGKVAEAKFFRLWEKPSVILLHQSVKNAFEQSQLRGVQTIVAEGYRQ